MTRQTTSVVTTTGTVTNRHGVTFKVGDLVVNFNQGCRVVGFHHITRDLILRETGLAVVNGQTWLASPDLTYPAA